MTDAHFSFTFVFKQALIVCELSANLNASIFNYGQLLYFLQQLIYTIISNSYMHPHLNWCKKCTSSNPISYGKNFFLSKLTNTLRDYLPLINS